jgi:hypothetical protein
MGEKDAERFEEFHNAIDEVSRGDCKRVADKAKGGTTCHGKMHHRLRAN